MRQYQPIWEQIKKYKEVSIAATPRMQPRIVKAVTKEKHMDIGWKILCSENQVAYRLKHKTSGKIIKFYLVETDLIRITRQVLNQL